VEPSGLEAAFERLIAGDFAIEERMTLAVVAGRGGREETHLVALNEALIEKTSPGHTVRIATTIAGRPFMTYLADGLLVSTPTGSTAYNLSVRGPIVSPRLRAMVLTPIAAHLLFDRSLVLEPEEWLQLTLLDGREAALVVDGSTVVELAPGDSVTVRLGAYPARIVTFGPRDFHAILRAKFGLTDR
jgi:NAD+ kinase